jgi:hypothetical protein
MQSSLGPPPFASSASSIAFPVFKNGVAAKIDGNKYSSIHLFFPFF